MITIDFTDKEYRRLLDLVYVGNWIINSTRSNNDRFEDYDLIQEKIFYQCLKNSKFNILAEKYQGSCYPSRAYEDGGIHEVIAQYEGCVFFEILAEELSRRDLMRDGASPEELDEIPDELCDRIDEYLAEFEQNGLDNVNVDMPNEG
ncbi:MAG: DUF4175 domain-containing protein [Oscillospiraceae bacterium]|nr:DUF4175 domain-containing protein [Oscillospiraceae bacterium]